MSKSLLSVLKELGACWEEAPRSPGVAWDTWAGYPEKIWIAVRLGLSATAEFLGELGFDLGERQGGSNLAAYAFAAVTECMFNRPSRESIEGQIDTMRDDVIAELRRLMEEN